MFERLSRSRAVAAIAADLPRAASGNGLLAIMTLGVAARAAGLIWEGNPTWLFWFFLVSEAVGVAAIWLAARTRCVST